MPMDMHDLLKRTERSEDARAKTLYWLNTHIASLGADAQVRVIKELIGDLRKALRDYRKQPPAPITVIGTKTELTVSKTQIAVRKK